MYRKPMVKDGSCLFRAVADQVCRNLLTDDCKLKHKIINTHLPCTQLFLSQSEHPQVRARCVAHLRKHREDFEPFLDETEPWDRYLENMSKLQTWGGELEIQALSQLLEYVRRAITWFSGDTQRVQYRVDFVLYRTNAEATPLTSNAQKRVVRLCFTSGNHYDSVYSLPWLDSAALCQCMGCWD